MAGQVGGGLGAAGDLELGQDAGDVVLDRLLGQVELLADLLVGPAGRYQFQDPLFHKKGTAEDLVKQVMPDLKAALAP